MKGLDELLKGNANSMRKVNYFFTVRVLETF